MRPIFGQIASRVFLWQRANHAVFLARNIVLAWFISPSEQGWFATGLNLTIYFTLLTTFEFRTPILTTRNPSRELWNTQWSAEMALSLTALLLGLAATPLLLRTRDIPIVASLLGLLVANVVEVSASSHLYAAEKAMEFPFLTALRTVVNILSFGVCLLIAVMGWGWEAMVIDRMISAIMIATVLWTRSGLRLRFQFDYEQIRYLWSTIKVLFLCGVFGKIAMGFDMYAVGRWLSGEAAGLYQMALKWALVPMEIGGGFLAMMALSWHAAHAHEGQDALRRSYHQITFHLVRFCAWTTVCLALFLSELFRWVYKPEWQAVPGFFLLLLPYIFARPFQQNCFQVLLAMKQNRFLLGVSIVHAGLLIVLTLLALPWGLTGIIVAAGASLLASYALLEQKIHRLLKTELGTLFVHPLLIAFATLALAYSLGCFGLAPAILFSIKVALSVLYTFTAYGEWSRGRRRAEESVVGSDAG